MIYLEAFEIAEKEAAKGKPALICKDGDRFYVNITEKLPLTSVGHGFIRLHPDGKVDPLTDEAIGFARDLAPAFNSEEAEHVIAEECSATSVREPDQPLESTQFNGKPGSPIPIKQHVTSSGVVRMN